MVSHLEHLPYFCSTDIPRWQLFRMQGPGIAGHQPQEAVPGFQSFGLQRLDHAVGNVPDLMEQVAYMESFLGESISMQYRDLPHRAFRAVAQLLCCSFP